jgi:hypothetical protein
MTDPDLDRRRWEVFLDALESGLDQLSDNARFPMIVPPPDRSTLPADLAERANAVLGRLAEAEAQVEAAIERNWASHPRSERVARVDHEVAAGAFNVLA